MKIYNIKDMKDGWFCGFFKPSVLNTQAFEVGYKIHKQGEKWATHYHKLSIEINLLIKGKMVIQGQEINSGEIFVISPWEISDASFLEDCFVICVKVPSSPGDKYIVKE